MKTWKLVSGIVSIATRNGSKGGNIARFIFAWCDLCNLSSCFFEKGAMIIYYRYKKRKDFYICRINQPII